MPTVHFHVKPLKRLNGNAPRIEALKGIMKILHLVTSAERIQRIKKMIWDERRQPHKITIASVNDIGANVRSRLAFQESLDAANGVRFTGQRPARQRCWQPSEAFAKFMAGGRRYSAGAYVRRPMPRKR